MGHDRVRREMGTVGGGVQKMGRGKVGADGEKMEGGKEVNRVRGRGSR